MTYNFLSYEQRQNFLLPPSILEWVREDSLECFVSELIEQKGRLSSFYDNYRSNGWGRAAYHPQMLAKVLVYAYCRGITSSRKIAQALEPEVAFRFLPANQQPDFRTISDPRKDNLARLKSILFKSKTKCQQKFHKNCIFTKPKHQLFFNLSDPGCQPAPEQFCLGKVGFGGF